VGGKDLLPKVHLEENYPLLLWYISWTPMRKFCTRIAEREGLVRVLSHERCHLGVKMNAIIKNHFTI